MVIALLATYAQAALMVNPYASERRLLFANRQVAALLCQPALRSLSENLCSNLKESIPVIALKPTFQVQLKPTATYPNTAPLTSFLPLAPQASPKA